MFFERVDYDFQSEGCQSEMGTPFLVLLGILFAQSQQRGDVGLIKLSDSRGSGPTLSHSASNYLPQRRKRLLADWTPLAKINRLGCTRRWARRARSSRFFLRRGGGLEPLN